jgi:hypothetical protein
MGVYNWNVRALVVLVLVACGSRSTPVPEPPQPIVQEPPPAPEEPARVDIAVGEGPMSLAVADGDLVWTDSAGAIWTMRERGGEPTQLSDQHGLGFMFHPVAAGLRIFVSGKRDFARVADGKATKLALALPEDPVDVVASDQVIFCSLFKRNEVMAIPVGGGAPSTLFSMPRAVLAFHGTALFAVSYSTGALMFVPGRGKPQTIAGGFVRPTALAVDDTHAYVYSEREKSIRRLELANPSKTDVIATDLENADDLVEDGKYLYTYSWPSTFVRIAKDGSRKDVLADDLKSPHDIAVTGDAVYVVSRDQNKIVRFRK